MDRHQKKDAIEKPFGRMTDTVGEVSHFVKNGTITRFFEIGVWLTAMQMI